MWLHKPSIPFKSIVWQVVLPVPIALVIALGILGYFVPTMVVDNVRRTAVHSAVQTVSFFKELRAYYTEAVVNKVVSISDVTASQHHETDPGSIPLPATMIHDLSRRLEAEDTTVKLYSEYPFSGQSDRTLDAFEQQAWEFLNDNPEQIFERRETIGGEEVVRVAVADRMVAQVCVDCHNSHPDTPKNDWRLGDVRGVLEVNTIITEPLAYGQKLSTIINSTLLLAVVIVLAVVFIAAIRIARPLGSVTSAMELVAVGNKSIAVPEIRRQDEIGKLARAVQVFKDNLIKVELLSEKQRQHTSQLSAALRKEREFNALHREFVAMASHEFRTPLAIIDGAAQRLFRRKDRVTPEDIETRSKSIRNAVKRMIGLIDSTLSTARLESGQIEMNAEPHDLRALIAEACGRQQDISESHRIRVDVGGLPQRFMGDPSLLGQVITNLLSNAVKYSPGSPDIDVSGRLESGFAVVSVADRGLGMAQEDVPRLFQRFFRAGTSAGIAGTGMGLHLIKHLVGMHGGHIDVQSEVGAGTTFLIYLPLDNDLAAVQPAAKAAAG